MNLTKLSLVTALTTGSLAAQGVFDVSPNDGLSEDIPLEFTGTVNLGYDDNITPSNPANRGDSATYTSMNVGANYLNFGPQTNIDFNLKLGILHYLDNVENSDVRDTYSDTKGILNVKHNVSERLYLQTRNYLFYGLEPDYTYGVVNDRSNSEYLLFSTDNSLGYKWNARMATVTGFGYRNLDYDDAADSRSDRESLTLHHQFRYVVSQQTISTLDYRYITTNVAGGLDSASHKLLAGAEHRLSDTAMLVGKVGVQFRKVDTRDSNTDPTFELAYIQSVNEAFRVRLNAAYDVNDYGTSIDNNAFANNKSFRFSTAGDYHLSRQLYFTGGVNFVTNNYDGSPTRDDDDAQVVNFHLGATYSILDNLAANLTYNYTKSYDDGDTLNREYGRNRIQAGVTYTF